MEELKAKICSGDDTLLQTILSEWEERCSDHYTSLRDGAELNLCDSDNDDIHNTMTNGNISDKNVNVESQFQEVLHLKAHLITAVKAVELLRQEIEDSEAFTQLHVKLDELKKENRKMKSTLDSYKTKVWELEQLKVAQSLEMDELREECEARLEEQASQYSLEMEAAKRRLKNQEVSQRQRTEELAEITSKVVNRLSIDKEDKTYRDAAQKMKLYTALTVISDDSEEEADDPIDSVSHLSEPEETNFISLQAGKLNGTFSSGVSATSTPIHKRHKLTDRETLLLQENKDLRHELNQLKGKIDEENSSCGMLTQDLEDLKQDIQYQSQYTQVDIDLTDWSLHQSQLPSQLDKTAPDMIPFSQSCPVLQQVEHCNQSTDQSDSHNHPSSSTNEIDPQHIGECESFLNVEYEIEIVSGEVARNAIRNAANTLLHMSRQQDRWLTELQRLMRELNLECGTESNKCIADFLNQLKSSLLIQYENLKQQIFQLREELKNKDNEIQNQGKQIEELQSLNTKQEEDIKKASDELVHLQERLLHQQEEFKERIDELKGEIAHLRDERNRFLNETKKREEDLEAEHAAVLSKLVGENSLLVKEHDEEIQSLLNRIKEEISMRNQSEDQILQLSEKLSAVEEELKCCYSESFVNEIQDKHQQEIDAADAKYKKDFDEFELNHQEEIRQLNLSKNEQIEQAEKKWNDEREEAITALMTNIETLTQRKEDAESTIKRLHCEVDAARNSMKSSEELDRIMAENRALQSSNEQLTRIFTSLSQSCGDVEQSMSDWLVQNTNFTPPKRKISWNYVLRSLTRFLDYQASQDTATQSIDCQGDYKENLIDPELIEDLTGRLSDCSQFLLNHSTKLQTNLSNKEEAISQLQEQLEGLNKDLESGGSVTEQLQEYAHQERVLTNQLEALAQERDYMANQVSQIAELEAQLESKNGEIGRLTQQLENAKQYITERMSLSSLPLVQEVEEEEEEEKKSILQSELEHRIKQLEQHKGDLEMQLEQMSHELDSIRHQHDTEMKELQLQISSMDRELKMKAKFLDEQTREREQEREDAEKEVNQLNEINKKLQSEIVKFTKDSTSDDSDYLHSPKSPGEPGEMDPGSVQIIHSLRRDLEESELKRESLQLEVAALQERNRGMQSHLDSLKDEYEALKVLLDQSHEQHQENDVEMTRMREFQAKSEQSEPAGEEEEETYDEDRTEADSLDELTSTSQHTAPPDSVSHEEASPRQHTEFLNKRLAETIEEVNGCKDVIEKLQLDCEEHKKRAAEMEEEKLELCARVNDQEAALVNYESICQEMQLEFERYKALSNDQVATIREKSEEIQQLRDEQAQLSGQGKTCPDCDEWKERVADLESHLHTYSEDTKQLKDSLNDKEKEVSQLKSVMKEEMKRLTQDLTAREAMLEASREEILHLRDRLDCDISLDETISAPIGNSNSCFNGHSEEFERLGGELRQRDSALSELKVENMKLRKLNDAMEDLNSELKMLSKESELESNRLRSQLHDKINEIDNLTFTYEALLKEFEALKCNLDSELEQEEEDKNWRETLRQLEVDLESARRELVLKESEIHEMREAQERSESKILQWSKLLVTKENVIEQLNEEILSKESVLEEYAEHCKTREKILAESIETLECKRQMLSDLNEELVLKSDTIDKLTTELNQLKIDLQSADTKSESLSAKIETLEDCLKNSEQLLIKRDQEIESQTLQLEKLKCELSEKELSNKSVTNKMNELIANYESEAHNQESDTHRVQIINSQLENSQKLLEEAQNSATKLSMALEEEKELSSALQKKLDDQSAEIKELQTRLDNTEKLLTDAQHESTRVTMELDKEKECSSALRNELEEKVGEISALEKDLNEKIGEISALEKELNEKVGEISALEKELNEKVGEISALEKELNEKVGEISALEKESTSLTNFKNELQNDFDTVQTMLDIKEGEIEAMEKDNDNMKVKVADLESKLLSLESDVREKNSVIERMGKQEIQLKQEKNELEEDGKEINEQFKNENVELLGKMAILDCDLSAHQTQIHNLEEKIQSLVNEKVSLTGELSRGQHELYKLKDQVTNLHDDLRDSRARIEALELENKTLLDNLSTKMNSPDSLTDCEPEEQSSTVHEAVLTLLNQVEHSLNSRDALYRDRASVELEGLHQDVMEVIWKITESQVDKELAHREKERLADSGGSDIKRRLTDAIAEKDILIGQLEESREQVTDLTSTNRDLTEENSKLEETLIRRKSELEEISHVRDELRTRLNESLDERKRLAQILDQEREKRVFIEPKQGRIQSSPIPLELSEDEDDKEELDLNDTRTTTSEGRENENFIREWRRSSSPSDDDKVISQKLKIVLNRIQEEGVHFLTFSQLNALKSIPLEQSHEHCDNLNETIGNMVDKEMNQERTNWHRERQALLSSNRALKDLVADIDVYGDSTRDSAANRHDNLLKSVHNIFETERSCLLSLLETYLTRNHRDWHPVLHQIRDKLTTAEFQYRVSLDRLFSTERQGLIEELNLLQEEVERLRLSDDTPSSLAELNKSLSPSMSPINWRERARARENEIEQMTQQVEAITSHLRQTEEMAEELEKSLTEERVMNERIQFELERANDRITHLEESCVSHQSHLSQTRDMLESETTKRQTLANILEEEHLLCSRLKRELESEQKHVESLTASLDKERRAVSESSVLLAEKDQECYQQIQTERARHEEQRENWNQERSLILTEYRNLESKVMTIKSQLDQERIVTAQLSSMGERQHSGEMSQLIESARTREKDHKEEISSLHNQLEQQRKKVMELENSLNKSNANQGLPVSSSLVSSHRSQESASRRVSQRPPHSPVIGYNNGRRQSLVSSSPEYPNRPIPTGSSDTRSNSVNGEENSTADTHIQQPSLGVQVSNLPQHQQDASSTMLQWMYARYLRAESYRRALMYQKRYLLLVVGRFQESENSVVISLARIDTNHYSYPLESTYLHSSRALLRFKGAVRMVFAIYRMKRLVIKWRKSGARQDIPDYPLAAPRLTKTSLTSYSNYQPHVRSSSATSSNHGLPPVIGSSYRSISHSPQIPRDYNEHSSSHHDHHHYHAVPHSHWSTDQPIRSKYFSNNRYENEEEEEERPRNPLSQQSRMATSHHNLTHISSLTRPFTPDSTRRSYDHYSSHSSRPYSSVTQSARPHSRTLTSSERGNATYHHEDKAQHYPFMSSARNSRSTTSLTDVTKPDFLRRLDRLQKRLDDYNDEMH